MHALPHIQKYHDKIVVVKYGGNAMTNAELKEAVMSDIVLLSEVGIKVVLVHGGGPEINAMLKRVGIESKFINGLRYTDAETIDIVQMVLCGKVNKDLVDLLCSHTGGAALGLCGLDDHMIEAEQLDPDLGSCRRDYSGKRKPYKRCSRKGLYPCNFDRCGRQGRNRIQYQCGYGGGKNCG